MALLGEFSGMSADCIAIICVVIKLVYLFGYGFAIFAMYDVPSHKLYRNVQVTQGPIQVS